MNSTLKLGSKNADVKTLQDLLNNLLKLNPKLATDGNFGPRTDAAVRKIQAQLNVGVDGIVGPKTWQALEGKKHGKPVLTPPIVVDTITNNWMQIALREAGQKEIPGSQDNPRILAYHSSTTLKANTDETAWCSSFVNWVLKEAKITGTNSAAAASWVNWGERTTAKSGAITVIRDANAANSSLTRSGNHVGFLIRETATHYELLGGNQSNMVKKSSFPKTSWSLLGYRWPK